MRLFCSSMHLSMELSKFYLNLSVGAEGNQFYYTVFFLSLCFHIEDPPVYIRNSKLALCWKNIIISLI